MLGLQSVYSQERSITIVNAKDLKAIPYVSVQFKNKVQYSDHQGNLDIRDTGPYTCYHINYEKQLIKNLVADTIFMKERQIVIQGVTIESKRIITEIKQSKKSDFKSFGFIYPNLLISHTKTYISGEDKIQLLDAEGKLINEISLDFEFDKMIETCDKQFFLVSKHFAYLLSVSDQLINISSKVTMRDFRINYTFCESNNALGRIYKYSHINNLISDFYIIHKHGKLKHLKQIADHDLKNNEQG